MRKSTLDPLGNLIARSSMSLIFILAGLSKIGGYTATQAYMETAGVPGVLLPLVIALELGGGLALLLGVGTRTSAAALAMFSLVAAVLFHADFADQMQSVLFMKNLAIAGGLLMVTLHGPGAWSLDRVLESRNAITAQ